MADEIPDLHVVVKFGKGIPPGVQGTALLEFEKIIRRIDRAQNGLPGKWIEVFKEAKGDDSRLRAAMTKEQRERL